MIYGDNSAILTKEEYSLDVFCLPERFRDAYLSVLRRRERAEECGRRGHMASWRHRDSGVRESRYHPHSCGSLACPLCSKRRFWKDFKKYEHAVVGEVAFVTLTMPNMIVRSIEDVEYAFKEAAGRLEKLYQFCIFGKRAWRRVERLYWAELERYRESVGDEEKVERHRRFFEEFRARYKDRLGEHMRFGELVKSIWRFEVTVRVRGGVFELHPHWHGIILGYIPKLLITAIWREVTGQEGYIVDVRRARDEREVMKYLEGYLIKGWEFENVEGNEFEVNQISIWLEVVMKKKRLFRVWGIEPREREDDGWELEKSFWSVEGELKTRRNLVGLRKFVRKMRREKKDRELFDYVVFRDIGKEYPLYVELRGDRVYFILDIPDEDLHLFRKHHYLGSNLGSKKDVGEESWDSEWWWWEMQAEKEREE